MPAVDNVPDPRAAAPKLAYPEPEAARLLGISERTLFTLRQEGRIAYVKLGARVLYRAAALRQFLRDNETPAAAPAAVGDTQE